MNDSNSVANRVPFQFWIVLILLNLGLIISIVNAEILKTKANPANPAANPPTASPSPSPTATQTLAQTNKTPVSIPPAALDGQDLFVFSSNPYGSYQIYVFAPGILPITRLFDDNYEKIHPAVNPDNTKIAYSARKNGYWDLYVYNLLDKTEIRLTDTPEYEGNPTWSPDGLFIAYETYRNGNLDIYIQSLTESDQSPAQLTDSPDADFSPAWSPSGRDIAFVSTRSGEDEIWVAHLDSIENRFTNASNSPDKSDQHPAWSNPGNTLVWTSDRNGYPIIQKMDPSSGGATLQQISEGTLSVWSGNQLYYLQQEANLSFVSSRSAFSQSILLPSTLLPGQVNGLSILQLADVHQNLIAELSAESEKQYFPIDHTSGGSMANRSLTALQDVQAPQPYLISAVVDSFNSLRENVAAETGWDFLNALDKAFVPITDPANPGAEQHWEYTGRAIEFNPLTIYAGLACIVREERNGQTYWRVFLKTRYQDGSQGMPMTQIPWILDSRYSLNPSAYETGGARAALLEGYWLDFTALALSYGWERLPAASNWETYYPGARFNQFVSTGDMDWYTAMNNIYPAEALKSPTPLPSATLTPSVTPTIRFFRSPTATLPPTQTLIPTRRPTWTPEP